MSLYLTSILSLTYARKQDAVKDITETTWNARNVAESYVTVVMYDNGVMSLTLSMRLKSLSAFYAKIGIFSASMKRIKRPLDILQ
jgi:hypothetical protein